MFWYILILQEVFFDVGTLIYTRNMFWNVSGAVHVLYFKEIMLKQQWKGVLSGQRTTRRHVRKLVFGDSRNDDH